MPRSYNALFSLGRGDGNLEAFDLLGYFHMHCCKTLCFNSKALEQHLHSSKSVLRQLIAASMALLLQSFRLCGQRLQQSLMVELLGLEHALRPFRYSMLFFVLHPSFIEAARISKTAAFKILPLSSAQSGEVCSLACLSGLSVLSEPSEVLHRAISVDHLTHRKQRYHYRSK